MIEIKVGVKLAGLTPQGALLISIVHGVYLKYGVPCVITSVCDGVHSRGSKHYIGCGVDFRTHNIREAGLDPWVVADDVRSALGANFDVILEAAGSPNEHLHVEWDPK